MKMKHRNKAVALLLSASLAAGLCVSCAAADNDSAGADVRTEVSENAGSRPEGAPEGAPGDFPGEPPEGEGRGSTLLRGFECRGDSALERLEHIHVRPHSPKR